MSTQFQQRTWVRRGGPDDGATGFTQWYSGVLEMYSDDSPLIVRQYPEAATHAYLLRDLDEEPLVYEWKPRPA